MSESETRKQARDDSNAANETSQASESASEAASAARQVAKSFPDVVKDWIERQPYAAVGIALAIGWLYGRRHRPF